MLIIAVSTGCGSWATVMGAILQGFAAECRYVNVMAWKDPDFDLQRMHTVLCHLYLDGVPCSNSYD